MVNESYFGARKKSKLYSLLLSFWENIGFPGGSVVKNLPALKEVQVWSLHWEGPLEEGTATHSNILAWRIPIDSDRPGKFSLMQYAVQFSSVTLVSSSLWPHEPQHARPPCPSPTPGVHPDPCPSSRWCHPTISSSVVPFSSCPQSFPASGSFQMSQLFAWGGQSIGVSASTADLPVNTQDWSPCSPRDSQESSPTPQFKSINSLAISFLYSPTLISIHDYWKNHSLDLCW